MRATEKSGKKRLFLLDEPGANLHAKAQGDVLRLINELSKDITIVYSTHSSHMIEEEKLYRILAVQRDGEGDDTPTTVVDAHRLCTASTDTLSPLLTAMGMDLSNQKVIQKNNNVILEEMSAHYYLKALWILKNEQQDAHFIAATGVNKVETLANLFVGWGLDFIIAVDDDTNARGVFNSLKRSLYGDDAELANANMIKIKDAKGIEDIFSRNDFKKFVLKDEIADSTKENSELAKNRSKPVLAFQFLLSVKGGSPKWADFDEETQVNASNLVGRIATLLRNKAQRQ